MYELQNDLMSNSANTDNSPCHNCNKPYNRQDFRLGSGGGDPLVCDECKGKRWEEEQMKRDELNKITHDHEMIQIIEKQLDPDVGSDAVDIQLRRCEYCGKTLTLTSEDFQIHKNSCPSNNELKN